jgi:Uma2 family endonuclease
MVSTVTWPNHLLTLDDWDALPEDNHFRLEVVEGILIVSPRPVFFHQRAVTRLTYLIDEQLPTGLSAVSEVDVVLAEHPLTIRSPDVVVTSAEVADSNPARCRATDVHLALEVLSEGSVRTDRVTKFSEYAEAGIDHYWIVDLDAPPSLTLFRLIDGGYELFGELTGATTIEFDGVLVKLDLDALTTSRARKL